MIASFNTKILVSTGLAMLALAVGEKSPAYALTKEELRCFAEGKDEIIGLAKLDVLEIHLVSPIHAKYDKNCNGVLDPTEIAKIEMDARELVNGRKRPRELDDLRTRITQSGGIPIKDLATPPKPEKPDAEEQRIFLRRDRIDIGIAGKIPDFKDAAGATLSISRDFLKSETIVNVQGVLSYVLLKNTRVEDSRLSIGDTFLSAYAFGPFIEVDSSRSSKQAKPIKDKIVGGGLGQFELFGGPLFNRQLVSFSGYYQTDSYGLAEIYGGKVTWEPQALRIGLGSRTRFTDLFDYTWRVFAALDYLNVRNPGRTALKANADYLWIGGGTILKIWPFPDLLESRVFVEAYPAYYYNTISGEDAKIFTSTAGVTLDPDGHSAITVSYVTGRDYSTGVTSRKITGQLAVKY